MRAVAIGALLLGLAQLMVGVELRAVTLDHWAVLSWLLLAVPFGTAHVSAAGDGPYRACKQLWARICACISDCIRLRHGTMTFMNSPAAFLVMMLALGASTMIGVDLLQAGASLLLVAAWFLIAPVVVLVLMFCGLEKVVPLLAVLQPAAPSGRTWESCELKRLHRPPRS